MSETSQGLMNFLSAVGLAAPSQLDLQPLRLGVCVSAPHLTQVLIGMILIGDISQTDLAPFRAQFQPRLLQCPPKLSSVPKSQM